jgi:cyclase
VKYVIHPLSKASLDEQAERAQAPNASGRGSVKRWRLPIDAELVFAQKPLTLGTEPIQILFLGRAHTGGDLSVYLPRQKILFMSETFLNRVFPAMRSAYPSDWLKALDKAEAINADLYIPGHGFTESGPVSKEELRTYHKALAAVIAEATRLHKAGVPIEEAVKQAKWGEYGSWTLASSQGPIAIRRVYEELDGKLK